MAYELYGAEGAVSAVLEFLRDGTVDYASGSVADTLNEVLAARRTALGITASDLPDVAQFEAYWPRAPLSGLKTPHLLVEWDGHGEELDGPAGRQYDHEIVVSIHFADADVDGAETETALAAVRYADALRVLLNRRTPRLEGRTLNGGGTSIPGQVVFARVDSIRAVPTGSAPNYVVVARLVVRVAEVY